MSEVKVIIDFSILSMISGFYKYILTIDRTASPALLESHTSLAAVVGFYYGWKHHVSSSLSLSIITVFVRRLVQIAFYYNKKACKLKIQHNVEIELNIFSDVYRKVENIEVLSFQLPKYL